MCGLRDRNIDRRGRVSQTALSRAGRTPEAKIFPALDELGIGTTAYGVFSRGLLTGSVPGGAGDVRGYFPRFRAGNLEPNRELAARLGRLAAGRGIQPAQLAVAWVLARRSTLIPVIGARTRRQLAEVLPALEVKLGAQDMAEIESAIPRDAAAGDRYGEEQMRVLDSEK